MQPALTHRQTDVQPPADLSWKACRREYQSILCHETYHVMLYKIPWDMVIFMWYYMNWSDPAVQDRDGDPDASKTQSY